MDPLSIATNVYQTIRQRIIALETEIDDETLSDTLEGLTNFHEIIAAIVRSALIDQALVEGLKGHIQVLQQRMQRLGERSSQRRKVALDAMLEVQLKKITAPDFTASVRPGTPAVIVCDETLIPAPYWQPREPRLDRASLLNDLKNGVTIAGVQLANPEPVLSVRAK